MRYEESIAAPVNITIDTPAILTDFIQGHFKRPRHGYKPSRAMRICLHLMTHLRIGQLTIILPDNSHLKFGNKTNTHHAILHIHNDRAAKKLLRAGKLGFCESYLDGDWSSPDMTAFFKLILENADAIKRSLAGKKWMRAISYAAHILKPNSRRGSRKNIYSHYDIGNDFYAQWLDPSMTYSAALFKDGITDLKTAQDRKYEEMIRRLDLKPHHHLLEIGCGWGGFAEYAARKTGCKITAITISQSQYEYAKNRIENANLSDQVEIRLQDYRDTNGTFDRIASIEMFEAVGEAYWPTFFQTLKSRLKSGGHAVLQIITIRDKDFAAYRKGADYIQRYIFPGGMLPSMQALNTQIKTAGLTQGDHLSFGRDYAHTLKLWNQSFQNAWPNLTAKTLNTRFKRLWEQYLCYCEAGFDIGTIDVVQIAVKKP